MPDKLPVFIEIRTDDTPWPDDPEDADEFYKWLGITMVAWGRLEGQVVAVLMSIRALPGTTILPGTFPVSWKRKAQAWRTAFETMPDLKPYSALALQNIADIMFYVQKRHYLSHAMWRKFAENISCTAMHSFTVRPHDKDASDTAILIENVISVADLKAITAEANRLNLELRLISGVMASLRPLPSAFRPI